MRTSTTTQRRTKSALQTLLLTYCTLMAATFGDLGAAQAVPQKLAPEDQLSSKFRLDDNDPESSVPSTKEKNANPLEFGYFLQDLLVQAEGAKAAKDYAGLVRYQRALVKAAPERGASWGKLCEAYELIGDPAKAILACKQAVARDGATAADFVRLTTLTLQKPEGLPPAEVAQMKMLLDHLLTEDGSLARTVAGLRCQLAVKTSDLPLLQSCTTDLAKLAPGDAKTVIYQWSLAVRQGQASDAQRLFAQAKSLGVPAENLSRMAQLTPGLHSQRGRWIIAGLTLILAVTAAIYWSSQRRRFAHPL